MKFRIPVLFCLMTGMLSLVSSSFGQPLEYINTKAAAFAKAKAEGKLVMSDFGRVGCSDCDGTSVAMDSLSARIRPTLQAACVMWKSDIDLSSDYVPYTSSLPSPYALPVLCLIDPNNTAGTFIRRATGLQTPSSLYSTFMTYIRNAMPVLVTNLTGNVITNDISNAVFVFRGLAISNATIVGAVKGYPVASVMWRLNGTGSFQQATGTNRWSATTTLSPGVNTFEVYATYLGTALTSWTNKVTVTYEGDAASKLPQTITFTHPGSQTYGVPALPLVATASSGLPVTFTVLSGPGTLSGTNLTISGVGTIVVKAEQAGNTTYDPATPVTNSISIGTRPITVSAIATNKVYGSADPSFPYQITSGSLASGDAITGSLSRVSGASTGTYAIQIGTISAGANYSLSFVPANFTITPRPITVSANATNKVYGAADPTFTSQITSGSLVSGDSISGSLSRTPGTGAGNYTILQGTISAGTNYTLSFIGATFVIAPRPITVTADAKTKVAGTSDPQFTCQITSGSLISGDAITGSQSRVSGETPGSYAILQGSLTAGNNYSMSYVSANLTITANPLTITSGRTNRIVTLGSNTTFQVTATGATGYRWMRNGAFLSNGGSVSGATASTLSLNNITIADVGSYQCQVYNSTATNTFDAGGLWIMPGNARAYFGVPIFGPTNQNCYLEYSTNLGSTWIRLTNSDIKLQRAGQILVDEDALGQPKRFYRLAIP